MFPAEVTAAAAARRKRERKESEEDEGSPRSLPSRTPLPRLLMPAQKEEKRLIGSNGSELLRAGESAESRDKRDRFF